MRFTNIVSAAALTVALGFSGAAYAQTMVGGVSVTDIDLPRVQAMCDPMVGDTTDAVGEDPSNDSASRTSNADTKGIDDINLRDCVEAGLLPADTVIPADQIGN